MTDFTFWLNTLPEGVETHVWYPVGPLADKNVKTGLLTPGKQALLVPIKSKPSNPLPSHFLDPQIVHMDGLGDCLRLSWNRYEDPIIVEFVDDLLRTIGFTDNPVGCFLNKLNVWRDLLSRQGLLQLNKLSGLWGELYVCSRIQGSEPMWTGPSGTDVDFRSEKVAFDVKTTRLKNRLLFNVSGLHQFDFSSDDIFITWLRIETGTEKDESLQTLLKQIDRKRLLPSVKNSLESMLNAMPFSMQSEITFVCRDIKIFRVCDLPIITHKTLKDSFGDNASRISELTYQIDASGAHFEEFQFLKDLIQK